MDTETVTSTDKTEVSEPVESDGGDSDSLMADAQAVLDNLLDVVKSEREGILSSANELRDKVLADARDQAEREAAQIREDARASKEQFVRDGRKEAEDIVTDARQHAEREKRAALEIVRGTLDRLDEVDVLRERLTEIAATLQQDLADTVDSGTNRAEAGDDAAYVEVDPSAILTLADELGDVACRDVLDTFLTEMELQLGELGRALTSDADESRLISRTLHNLSSGCATVGARSLASVCGSLTVAALESRFDELERRAKTVRAEVAQIRDRELRDVDGVDGVNGVGDR